MGMTDRMMKFMVGRMSPEKKREMMLKMMPMMMEDVNMAETMVKMVPAMMDSITLLDIIRVLKKAFPALLQGVESIADFSKRLKAVAVKGIAAMPDLMERMLPVMEVVMPMMMGRIVPAVMTEDNIKSMRVIQKKMLPKMMANAEVRKVMPSMMTCFMPHCLEGMLPHVPEDKRRVFIESMQRILADQS